MAGNSDHVMQMLQVAVVQHFLSDGEGDDPCSVCGVENSNLAMEKRNLENPDEKKITLIAILEYD